MRGSMSRKGNCWDSAPTKGFSNSHKNERVHGVSYPTRKEATSDVLQDLVASYNRRLRRASLGCLAPTAFLQNWIEQQHQQEVAALARPVKRRKTLGASSAQ